MCPNIFEKKAVPEVSVPLPNAAIARAAQREGGLPGLVRHGPGGVSAGRVDFLQISPVFAASLS